MKDCRKGIALNCKQRKVGMLAGETNGMWRCLRRDALLTSTNFLKI